MHKIFLRFLFIIIIIFIALLVFLSTKGVKTNNFNSLIIQKVNEINPKIKLTLEEVSFNASDIGPTKIIINKKFVETNLVDLIKSQDLSKFIL